MSASTTLSEDAINRFRIIHPTDKETRPLARRLHRYATATSVESDQGDDTLVHDREMIRLETLKWKLGIERMMGSVKNLERQRLTYLARAEETVNRTESLKKTLEEEQALLETRRRERDRMIKCDEIAAKIASRGRNRQELDERIGTLRQTLEEHKAALKLYQETAQGRMDIFTKISDLVKDCRDLKLPIDPNATIPIEEEPEKMDVDEKAPPASTSNTSTGGSGVKLSSMSLPFQPTIGGSSSTTTTPSGSGSGSGSGPGSQRPSGKSGKSRSSTPPASAALPARPPTGPSSSNSGSGSGPGSGSGSGSASRGPTSTSRAPASSSLPSRPSNLRTSTTGRIPGSGGGNLEEGELGGDEDGEFKDRGMKRGLEADRSSGRSTRSRK